MLVKTEERPGDLTSFIITMKEACLLHALMKKWSLIKKWWV